MSSKVHKCCQPHTQNKRIRTPQLLRESATRRANSMWMKCRTYYRLACFWWCFMWLYSDSGGWQQCWCSWQWFIWCSNRAALTSHPTITVTLTTSCNIPENHTLNINCCENLEAHIVTIFHGHAATPIFNPEDGGNIFLRNSATIQQTWCHILKRPQSEYSPLWEPQISRVRILTFVPNPWIKVQCRMSLTKGTATISWCFKRVTHYPCLLVQRSSKLSDTIAERVSRQHLLKYPC
jgi:hypothetical protein